jgi:hypothetical protein
VTVWYPFGSARVRTTPAGRACRVDLDLDVENGEERYACTVPLGRPWTWDLVSDGATVRQAPPTELPSDLARLCGKR